jgi:hypothetical protein
MLRHALVICGVAAAIIGASIAIGLAYQGNRGVVVRDVRNADIIVYEWHSAYFRYWYDDDIAMQDPEVLFAEWADGFGVLSTASQRSGGPPYRTFHALPSEHDSLLLTLATSLSRTPTGGDPRCSSAECAVRIDVRREGSTQSLMSLRKTDWSAWSPEPRPSLSSNDQRMLLFEPNEARIDAMVRVFGGIWQDCRAAILEHVARAKSASSVIGSSRLVGELNADR